MNNTEFDVIKKYFTFDEARDDVLVAKGDDCASVSVPADKQLLITTDTLISGVHFPEQTSAADIAYKALMVNLSDLAAMGATPAWITLALTLPAVDESWLSEFSAQLKELLARYEISLIGGDTTRGPLSLTIQAMGLSDRDEVLRRDNAKPGEKIFVTGTLGDAAIGLLAVTNKLDDHELEPCIQRLNRPDARIDFGQALLHYSRCAIDISDGLIADIGHVLDASGCGAVIELDSIPVSEAAQFYFEHYNKHEIDWSLITASGDDYELCFTAGESHAEALYRLAETHGLLLSCIGEISADDGLLLKDTKGQLIELAATGFNHFG